MKEPFNEDIHRKAMESEMVWDAEQAIRTRESDRAAAIGHTERKLPPERRTGEMPPARSVATQDAPRRPAPQGKPQSRPAPKKSQAVNWKGYAILGGIALVAIAVVIGLIVLIASLVSGGKNDVPETTEPPVTEAPTEDPTSVAQRLVKRADALAAGYDYDAALAVLEEFGDGWEQQPLLADAKSRYDNASAKLVRWEDPTNISHIFFRSLIVDPARAFDGDENQDSYNQYYVTVTEFREILQHLYDRGFVLVSIHDTVKLKVDESGSTSYTAGDIYLPEGKTPIILSQDNVNYFEYMVDGDGDRTADAEGDGFAYRLMVGADGKPTAAYVDASGQTLYGEYDLVPIVESFIAEHPDFSYHGARGLLAVSGYEGVFGYRTHSEWKETLGEDAYLEEVRQAQELVSCLKECGWEIASHSYADINYSSASASSIKEDVQKWETQVQPIVGDTDVFMYPYGGDIGDVTQYSGDKYEALYEAGYRFFCNMESVPWMQIRDKYVRQGRRAIDGYRMWNQSDKLSDLFDAAQVFDASRPTPVPSIY